MLGFWDIYGGTIECFPDYIREEDDWIIIFHVRQLIERYSYSWVFYMDGVEGAQSLCIESAT